jgi:hypothetical protein
MRRKLTLAAAVILAAVTGLGITGAGHQAAHRPADPDAGVYVQRSGHRVWMAS